MRTIKQWLSLLLSKVPLCNLSFPLSLPLGPRQPLIYLLLLQVSLHLLWQSFSISVLLTLGLKRRNQLKKLDLGDLPAGPVAKTLCSQCRGPGLIPGQGTRSYMPQLRVHMLQQWSKVRPAATETCCSQINEFKNQLKKKRSQVYCRSSKETWNTLPELCILKFVKGHDVCNGRSVFLNCGWGFCPKGPPCHSCECHHWGGGSWHWMDGARNATEPLTVPRMNPHREWLSPRVSSARGETLFNLNCQNTWNKVKSLVGSST